VTEELIEASLDRLFDEKMDEQASQVAPADSAAGSPSANLRLNAERPIANADSADDVFVEASSSHYYFFDDDQGDSCCYWFPWSCFQASSPLHDPLLPGTPPDGVQHENEPTFWSRFCPSAGRSYIQERHPLPRLSSTVMISRSTPGGSNRMSSPSSPRLRASSVHTEPFSLNGTPLRSYPRSGDSRIAAPLGLHVIEVVRKVVMLGARNSGKSSVVHRFAEKRFGAAYDPTIESTIRAKIVLRGIHFLCDLLDTAGQDEYSSFSRQATVGVHGYCMVFSVTSMVSFYAIQKIHDRITDLVGFHTVPIVLVGTKSDDETRREVLSTTGEALAESWGVSYVECSAKSDFGIEDVFVTLLYEIEKDSGLLGTESSEHTEEEEKCKVCTIC